MLAIRRTNFDSPKSTVDIRWKRPSEIRRDASGRPNQNSKRISGRKKMHDKTARKKASSKSSRNIYKVFKMTILCSKKFMKRNVLQEALKHQKVM